MKEVVTISDDFKSYTLDSELPAERFADLIESVEVMRLEETSNSLLSYIHEIHKTTDQLLLTSGKESDLFVFDLNGDFVRKINRQGDGPEEYSDITDLWLENDTIAIYSRNQRKVMKYDLKGDFIMVDKLPNQAGHIYSYRNGYAMEMNYYPINDTSYYRFVVLNRQLEPVNKYFEIESLIPQGLSFSNNSVTPYKDGVLFHRIMNDTIYYLRDEKLSPLVHFDFGKDWYWKEEREVKGDFLAVISTLDDVWNATSLVGDQHIWISPTIGIGRTSTYFLIDRATGRIEQIDLRKSSNDKSIGFAKGWDNDKMIFTVQSEDVREVVSKLSNDQIKFRQGTTLEEIESSENPVLMWVKFKE